MISELQGIHGTGSAFIICLTDGPFFGKDVSGGLKGESFKLLGFRLQASGFRLEVQTLSFRL